jgi:hypothetical protein
MAEHPPGGGTMERVLKSVRITLPARRPPATVRVDQDDVEALRSASAVSRVGLWPPPRRG